MPQRQQITWAQLRVGVMVIVSLTVFAVGVFFISGQVSFLSRKYTLRTFLSNAEGLRPGSQVRIEGIPVGTVSEIRLSSLSEDSRAVEVVMRVPQSYQSRIRANSTASRKSAGVLGESYVDITRGGADRPVVPEGGEVQGSEEADIKRIVQNTNDVISNLRVLSSKLNDITTEIQSARGSIGKFIYDPALYKSVTETTAAAQRIVSGVERGEGTIGKLLTEETLHERVVASVDRLNKILDDVQRGQGSMAKFINDPSLYDNLKQTATRANLMMDNINQGKGTLGKLATDPTLYNRINDTMERLTVITGRIQQGEGTLGKLSTDPTLYNNLSTSSQSIKEFLTEFRKNPKKFLSVRVRLF